MINRLYHFPPLSLNLWLIKIYEFFTHEWSISGFLVKCFLLNKWDRDKNVLDNYQIVAFGILELWTDSCRPQTSKKSIKKHPGENLIGTLNSFLQIIWKQRKKKSNLQSFAMLHLMTLNVTKSSGKNHQHDSIFLYNEISDFPCERCFLYDWPTNTAKIMLKVFIITIIKKWENIG